MTNKNIHTITSPNTTINATPPAATVHTTITVNTANISINIVVNIILIVLLSSIKEYVFFAKEIDPVTGLISESFQLRIVVSPNDCEPCPAKYTSLCSPIRIRIS